MEILSNTQIETLKFYACVGAYAGLCADPPQGHEDAARTLVTAGLLRGEGESYAPTAAGLALAAPVPEAPKPRKADLVKAIREAMQRSLDAGKPGYRVNERRGALVDVPHPFFAGCRLKCNEVMKHPCQKHPSRTVTMWRGRVEIWSDVDASGVSAAIRDTMRDGAE